MTNVPESVSSTQAFSYQARIQRMQAVSFQKNVNSDWVYAFFWNGIAFKNSALN